MRQTMHDGGRRLCADATVGEKYEPFELKGAAEIMHHPSD